MSLAVGGVDLSILAAAAVVAFLILGVWLCSSGGGSGKAMSTSVPAAAPEPQAPAAPPVDLWAADLAEHDGTVAGKRLWLAADGFVFDVETGRDFYGPGGPYAAFSGRCVRVLAAASCRPARTAARNRATHRAHSTHPLLLLAFRDATIGLATMEVEVAKWTRTKASELSAAEADTLASWVARFRTKYRVVGFLNDGANPTTVAQAAAKGLLAA